MTLNYKSHDVLKTSGVVVKVGEYQGANFDEKTGKPVPSKFGVLDIRRMHDNATEPIPIFVDLHGKGLGRRELAGYAFRLGMSPDGTELAHNGFVFNSNAQKLIASGHDKVSPEITTMRDPNGNIVDRRIDALCFVPDGAIDGTELNYMVEKFSTVEGMAGQTTGTPTTPGTTAAPTVDIQAITNAAAEAAAKAAIAAVKPMIDEAVRTVGQNTQGAEITQTSTQTDSTQQPADPKMVAEIEKLKAQSAEQKEFTDKLIDEKYNVLVDQVKKLGILDPSKIVIGLTKTQAIETLTSIKANLIENATLNGVPQGLSNQGMGSKTEEQTFNECMTELGFNSEHYRNMFK